MTARFRDKGTEDAANKANRIRAAKTRDALRWLLADERGRGYLAAILRKSGALNFKEWASLSPEAVMHAEGHRVMGLRLLDDVCSLAPEQLPALLKAALAEPTDGETDAGNDEQ